MWVRLWFFGTVYEHLCYTKKPDVMDVLVIPNEADFRKWIKKAILECIEILLSGQSQKNADEEPLLPHKEIAGMFCISLVTLH